MIILINTDDWMIILMGRMLGMIILMGQDDGSWFMAHGSRLMAHGQGGPARPRSPGGRRGRAGPGRPPGLLGQAGFRFRYMGIPIPINH